MLRDHLHDTGVKQDDDRKERKDRKHREFLSFISERRRKIRLYPLTDIFELFATEDGYAEASG